MALKAIIGKDYDGKVTDWRKAVSEMSDDDVSGVKKSEPAPAPAVK